MTSNLTQVYPVIWESDRASLIDQTRLPYDYTRVEITTYQQMADAIKPWLFGARQPLELPYMDVSQKMESFTGSGAIIL